MNQLNFFTNDRYSLLKILYDNQVEIKDEYYISLSQQELADIAHHSKAKVNKMLNELKSSNYVESYKNTRGKYILTDKAQKVINLIEKTII